MISDPNKSVWLASLIGNFCLVFPLMCIIGVVAYRRSEGSSKYQRFTDQKAAQNLEVAAQEVYGLNRRNSQQLPLSLLMPPRYSIWLLIGSAIMAVGVVQFQSAIMMTVGFGIGAIATGLVIGHNSFILRVSRLLRR